MKILRHQHQSINIIDTSLAVALQVQRLVLAQSAVLPKSSDISQRSDLSQSSDLSQRSAAQIQVKQGGNTEQGSSVSFGNNTTAVSFHINGDAQHFKSQQTTLWPCAARYISGTTANALC